MICPHTPIYLTSRPLLFWSEQRVWVDIDGQSVGRWCSNVSIRQRDVGDSGKWHHTRVPEGSDKLEISSITNRNVMQPVCETVAFLQANHALSGGPTPAYSQEKWGCVYTHLHTHKPVCLAVLIILAQSGNGPCRPANEGMSGCGTCRQWDSTHHEKNGAEYW